MRQAILVQLRALLEIPLAEAVVVVKLDLPDRQVHQDEMDAQGLLDAREIQVRQDVMEFFYLDLRLSRHVKNVHPAHRVQQAHPDKKVYPVPKVMRDRLAETAHPVCRVHPDRKGRKVLPAYLAIKARQEKQER